MRPPGGRNASALLAALAALACGVDASLPPAPRPEIVASAVAGHDENVLAVLVTADLRHADSAAVRFGVDGTPRDSAAPAVLVQGGGATIPVLGLLPGTRYALEVIAFGPGGSTVSEPMTFDTGALPADLPSYRAGGTDPSAGYVAFAAGQYGIVIDNVGRVVWYHRFPTSPGLNFMAQPNGRWTARPVPADPSDSPPWVEIDPLGSTIRSFGCARGLVARFHDLIVEPDGGYWIMCDETRAMNLAHIGGAADARVTGTVIQHIDAQGDVLLDWTPFDHFDVGDIDVASLALPIVNWTHGNAIALDEDGGVLVSFRNLNEITKIDARTGAVHWRLGGVRNQFVIDGATQPAFARQHGVRVTGTGRLLLLDNLGDPGASRAERWEYDEIRLTARLIASYGSLPPVTAQTGGTTQELPGGRALVSFGSAARVEEYDAGGNVVWRMDGDIGYVFRAQRIGSLYHPVPTPLTGW